ncbi:hypothetical protein [Ferrovum myxofaciens]|uniref:hypothetical protein n=1 Tax=Ferrovum myxofaciens TaxID=416213 RepID=UPI003EB923C6
MKKACAVITGQAEDQKIYLVPVVPLVPPVLVVPVVPVVPLVEELLLEEDAMAAATITAGPMMASGVNPKRSPAPPTPSGPAGTGVSSAAKATDEKIREDARTKENFFMATTPYKSLPQIVQ